MTGAVGTTGPIGSTVLVNIIRRHAEEAALLWPLRDAAIHSPFYDLAALCRIDDRIEAHLDGLRIAGDAGWEMCRAGLVNPEAGEVFTAAVLAIERANVQAFAEVLACGAQSAALERGVVDALGWVPLARGKRYLKELLADDASETLHRFGIAGAAIHRYNPGVRLDAAVGARDVALRARALRTVGEIGRSDLLPALRQEFDSDDKACRFWAAWSALLLGQPLARDVLWNFALAGGHFGEHAFSMLIRATDLASAHTMVRKLAAAKETLRTALAGAAMLGDPELLPWIHDCMDDSEQARFAGWAFSMITGVNIVAEKLSRPPVAGFCPIHTGDPSDTGTVPDPDDMLPWPHASAIQAWYERTRAMLPSGSRLLLGKPMTPVWLTEVLRMGAQPARAAAAIELSLNSPGDPLFPLHAPGYRQTKLLAGM